MRRLSEPFVAELSLRPIGLLQLEAHAAEDLGRLRELDLAVVDDLHLVSPRVVEVEPGWGRHAYAGVDERAPGGLLVVDDETEVPCGVALALGTSRERDELVAQVDERHLTAAAAAQLELEELPVPRQGLIDVAHLERDVIDPDEPCHDDTVDPGGTPAPIAV